MAAIPKYRYIGQPGIKRQEGYGTVTGQLKHAHDIFLPNMLYVKIKPSPHAHAKVVSIDTSKAEKLPGVEMVLTYKDSKGIFDQTFPRRQVLTDYVRHVGEGVAAVAAVSEEIAEEACELIDVKYEVLPFVLDVEEAMKPEAPKLYPEGNTFMHNVTKRGDVEKGFAEADAIFEYKHRTKFEPNMGQEPYSTVTYVDESGKLVIWVPTQAIYTVRDGVATALKLPQNMVRCIESKSGQGFGAGLGAYWHTILACMFALKTRKPVKFVITRYQEMQNKLGRWETVQYFKVGVKKDGTLTALQRKINADAGAYGTGRNQIDSIMWQYICPNALCDNINAYTNKVSQGAYRCPDHPHDNAGTEYILDMVAHELKMDPVEFKKKNHTYLEMGRSQIPPGQPGSRPFSSCALRECVERATAIFGWKWRPPGTVGEAPKKRGIGFGSHCCSHGAMSVPMAAGMMTQRDGTTLVLSGYQDTGQGGYTTAKIIAAEVLGAKLEDVITRFPVDTDVAPDTGSSGGSRQTKGTGTAVKLAAEAAKKQLFDAAAKLLLVKPEELESKDSEIYIKATPDKKVTFAAAATRAYADLGSVIKSWASLIVPPGYDQNTFSAACMEVEVDTETGAVDLIKMVGVHDIGKVIFDAGAKNQAHGGWVQAWGDILFEEYIQDPGTGQCLNPNYLDYNVLTTADIPKIENIIVGFAEPIDAMSGHGQKGIGEPPATVPMGTLENAIYNAIGVRIDRICMSPDRILKALGKG